MIEILTFVAAFSIDSTLPTESGPWSATPDRSGHFMGRDALVAFCP
jgi:hypothetical protein